VFSEEAYGCRWGLLLIFSGLRSTQKATDKYGA
jgi:hypothetical protein